MFMLRLKIEGDKITEIVAIKCNKGEADHIWDASNLTEVSPSFLLSIRKLNVILIMTDRYSRVIGGLSDKRFIVTDPRLLPDSKRFENGMQAPA